MNPVEQLLADLPDLTAEQRVERIRALTAEERTELVEALNAIVQEQRAEGVVPTDETIAVLTRVTEALRVAAEVAAEEEAEAERLRTEQEQLIAEAERLLNGEQEAEEPETPAEQPVEQPPAEGQPADTPPAEQPAETPAPEGEPVGVTAAATTPLRRVPLRNVRRPESHAPANDGRIRQSIVAAAGIEGAGSDGTFASLAEFGQATIDLAHRIARSAPGIDHVLGRLRTPFPEDRMLRDSDVIGNSRKLTAVTAGGGLTAAGGPCAPLPIDYALYGLGTDQRPVKAAVPGFGGQARGGMRFRTGPVLGDYAGAVSRWTTTTDADAVTDSTLRKPCVRIDCGDEETVWIEAIPMCVTVGNILAINDPEIIARAWELAGITYARTAEADLLTKMGAASTQVTTAQLLGAMTDMLATIDMSVAAIRDTHRMGDNEMLHAMIPRWVRNMMKTDIARSLPAGSALERFRIADAEINSILESRDNLRITWTLDVEAGGTWPTQTDGTLVNYPDTVTWLLYPEGTFATVESPDLDLGITRDSDLIGSNDYQMFFEGFENVAKRGTVSYRLTSELCPNGASSGTVDPDLVCAAEGS